MIILNVNNVINIKVKIINVVIYFCIVSVSIVKRLLNKMVIKCIRLSIII